MSAWNRDILLLDRAGQGVVPNCFEKDKRWWSGLSLA